MSNRYKVQWTNDYELAKWKKQISKSLLMGIIDHTYIDQNNEDEIELSLEEEDVGGDKFISEES